MFRLRRANSRQVPSRTPASTRSHDLVLTAPCFCCRSDFLDEQRRF